MTTDRMQKKPVTMRGMFTTTALAASLLLASTAFAAEAGGTARTPQASVAEAADTTPGPRIDRTRPGRRQPAFGLRRLTPPVPARPASR